MSDNRQSHPKHVRDNRSRQLNNQDPTYHRSRGRSPRKSDRQSTKITRQNQKSSD